MAWPQVIIIAFLVLLLIQNARHNGKIDKTFRRIEMDLATIKAKVDAQTTVIQSAETLLATLAQEIRNGANDPAAMQAIADELDANSAELAASVAANTPAAPAG